VQLIITALPLLLAAMLLCLAFRLRSVAICVSNKRAQVLCAASDWRD